MKWLWMAVGLACASPWAAEGHVPVERPKVRRTTPEQLTVPLERFAGPGGMVVILSPDSDAETVVIQHGFRAGTVFEPSHRGGLAHLAEHIMFTGITPDTDYQGLLQSRGVIGSNAFTSRQAMSFVTELPAEELPVGLWIAADRLRELPKQLDRVDLERHKSIVLAERNERNVDREYGLVDEAIDRGMFPEAHPLHAGIGGNRATIAAITPADVRAFVERSFVLANSTLVVTGRFEPSVARELVARYFAGLPVGRRAADPELPRHPLARTVQLSEPLSRQPRVTVTWNISGQAPEAIDALEHGALLLTLSTDGAFGTRVHASVDRYSGHALFRMDVVLPYDKPVESALGEADAFLRYLTLTDMDRDLMDLTNLHRDRLWLFSLADAGARASALLDLELDGVDVTTHARAFERHWRISPAEIQETARHLLRKDRLMVHANPQRPRKPKVEREDVDATMD